MSETQITKAIIKKAFLGAALIRQPLLRNTIPHEESEHSINCVKAVEDNYGKFCQYILAELSQWQLTKLYFHHLVEARLSLNGILASDFILLLLDDVNALEQRLQRIHLEVENFQAITNGSGLPKAREKFEVADEILLDIWSEIFVCDRLLTDHKLNFTKLQKVIRPRDKPQIDLLALNANQEYAIEITRVRKRKFSGTTHPTSIEAMNLPDNLKRLRVALNQKLHDKNNQMFEFCKSEGVVFEKKLLILKTSQWEYQDARKVVYSETKALLDTGKYNHIDEIILFYDTHPERFDWIK